MLEGFFSVVNLRLLLLIRFLPAIFLVLTQLHCAPRKIEINKITEITVDPALLARLQTHGFPRIANEFQVCCGRKEVPTLFQHAFLWDVIIVDPAIDTQYLGPTGTIRAQNPNTILLAYFSAADMIPSRVDSLHQNLNQALEPGWFLKDSQGKQIHLYQLPSREWTNMLNPTTAFHRYLPQYINDNFVKRELVDGIYYDWMMRSISWLNHRRPPVSGKIDIDNDGKEDSDKKTDLSWVKGLLQLLENSRKIFGPDMLLIGNAGWNTGEEFSSHLSGIMIEQFLEGRRHNKKKWGWGSVMRTYSQYLNDSQSPRISILMANDDNRKNFQKMRFGIASALLFDGYFCFTNRQDAYGSVWWYDEYAVDLATGTAVQSLEHKGYLGNPVSAAYQEDDPSRELQEQLQDSPLKAETMIWRRDFQNGIVLVNPGTEPKFIQLRGGFRKIKGTVDPQFNDGSGPLTGILLQGNDGVILLNENSGVR